MDAERMIESWASFKANPIPGGMSLRKSIFLGNSLLSMRKALEHIESFFYPPAFQPKI